MKGRKEGKVIKGSDSLSVGRRNCIAHVSVAGAAGRAMGLEKQTGGVRNLYHFL